MEVTFNPETLVREVRFCECGRELGKAAEGETCFRCWQAREEFFRSEQAAHIEGAATGQQEGETMKNAQMTFTTEDLIQIIQTNDAAACNALLGLYARQTADEQQAQATGHKNGMGFNGTDAFILSSFAEQVKSNKARAAAGTLPNGHGLLSPKQLEILRKKLPKYGRQLAEIAAEKMAARMVQAPA